MSNIWRMSTLFISDFMGLVNNHLSVFRINVKHDPQLPTYCTSVGRGIQFNFLVNLYRYKYTFPLCSIHWVYPLLSPPAYRSLWERARKNPFVIAVQNLTRQKGSLKRAAGEQFAEAYSASPQLGPTSTSHLLGISNGTAFIIILAIVFASSFVFTDMHNSSCT